MMKLSYWKQVVTVLVFVSVAACSADEPEAAPLVSQSVVAFEFTPVPTATSPTTLETNTPVLEAEQFSVQVDNANIAPAEASDAGSLNSAETASPPEEIAVFSDRDESSQTSKRVDLIDRETLANSITASRNVISNLTYTINVADGVGTISCADVVTYYDQILMFEQYNVSPELHIANENYSRALTVITLGVQNLYDFCSRYLAGSVYDEILTREIEPADIWQQAIKESNTGMRSAENSVGWLKGDARLLSSIYDQVRIDLERYQTALSNPSLDSCANIRLAFEHIVLDSVVLDIRNSPAVTSYIAYRLAVDSINETGIGLYEFCDVSVGGAGQIANNSQLLPQGLIDTALIGHQQANGELNMAYFYIAPPTEEPNALIAESAQEGTTQPTEVISAITDEAAQPLTVYVISIQQSSQPHLWEIVVGFDASGSTAPYTLLTTGILNNNQTLAIEQTCDRNFRDTISVRDAAGYLYTSPLLEVQRSGVCGL